MSDMDEIMYLADDFDLRIIEDAACALGTMSSDGVMAGTIGDVGCFSLHASKGITTGEGGLISTNDDALADKIRRLSVFGDERAFRRSKNSAPFRFDPRAGNYKMSDISAAIGLSQMAKIDILIDWRIRVAQEWDDIIRTDPCLSKNIISRPEIARDHTHIYQSYVAVCAPGTRPDVMNYMKKRGFQCGIGTHSCHRYPEAFPGVDNLASSSYLYDHAISFPRYYGLKVREEWDKTNV
jgi:dTDP-4-amino-4,6-dideoxygalactose transaminase